APKPAAGDSAVAQPTTGTFTDLVRARELTGDTPSRHIPLQRHAPRNKRRAPSSFVWRARRAGTLVTARSGAPLSLEIGPNFPLGITCDSIAAWWDQQGRTDYPQVKKLLVLCDGGGSNSATMYLFKEDLQKLANRLGIEIRVAHYPPYCSKYNPIEHRLFPHLTRACRGVIFHT